MNFLLWCSHRLYYHMLYLATRASDFDAKERVEVSITV
jgi:hypothetical protein